MDMLSTIILTVVSVVGIIFGMDMRARYKATRRKELGNDIAEQQAKIQEGVKKAREKLKEYQDAKKNFINRSNSSNKSDS